jgi:predicted nucleic acid-binding protein
MKMVFADTGYWIALFDPQDTLNPKAIQCSINLASETICTSEMVLTEFLNHFAKRGKYIRRASVNFISSLQKNPAIIIAPQTSDLYQQALILYGQREDQAWSHTDCSSFCIMNSYGITEALAYDKHFEQAGFTALLR